MSGPIKGLLWLAGAAGVAFLFYKGILVGARHLPRSVEDSLFGDVQPFKHEKICRPQNKKAAEARRKLLDRLFPILPDDNFNIEVNFVREKAVNAFTFLGGQIYIFEGLLKKAESPEEVAGVLSHELEHVKQRHITSNMAERLIMRAIIQIAASSGDFNMSPELLHSLMSLQFSRDQETEADQGALERLQAAQINAAGFKQFFERSCSNLGPLSLLTTHPSDSSRMALVEKYLRHPSKPLMTPEEWRELKTICED